MSLSGGALLVPVGLAAGDRDCPGSPYNHLCSSMIFFPIARSLWWKRNADLFFFLKHFIIKGSFIKIQFLLLCCDSPLSVSEWHQGNSHGFPAVKAGGAFYSTGLHLSNALTDGLGRLIITAQSRKGLRQCLGQAHTNFPKSPRCESMMQW